MTRKASFLALTLLATLPLGCAHQHHSTGSATIVGTVKYPGKLPPDASLTVYLVKNTLMTGAVEVLANDTLDFQGGSPVAYSIAYNPAEVEAENRYTIGARATGPDGQVILKSNGYLVLTKGGPSNDITIEMTPTR